MNYFRIRNKRIQSYKASKEVENKKDTSNENQSQKQENNEIDKDTLDEFLKAFGG